MHEKYIGIRVWVPRYEVKAADGLNATILTVSGEHDGCLLAVVEVDGLALGIAVKENYDFFWSKPTLERPKVKVPVTKWARVYRHKKDGRIELATSAGSWIPLADQKEDVADRNAANPDWEYFGVQPIIVKVQE